MSIFFPNRINLQGSRRCTGTYFLQIIPRYLRCYRSSYMGQAALEGIHLGNLCGRTYPSKVYLGNLCGRTYPSQVYLGNLCGRGYPPKEYLGNVKYLGILRNT